MHLCALSGLVMNTSTGLIGPALALTASLQKAASGTSSIMNSNYALSLNTSTTRTLTSSNTSPNASLSSPLIDHPLGLLRLLLRCSSGCSWRAQLGSGLARADRTRDIFDTRSVRHSSSSPNPLPQDTSALPPALLLRLNSGRDRVKGCDQVLRQLFVLFLKPLPPAEGLFRPAGTALNPPAGRECSRATLRRSEPPLRSLAL